MKKLMILGGSLYIVPVIEKAHELGIYVVTCDYEPDNPAHKYSDQYCYASTVDKEAVLECAKKCSIDGIISFACDSGVVSAAYAAEKLGLPFQCSYQSARILQDKGLFRKFLLEHGFQTPKSKRYAEKREAFADAGSFRWPVIVKPVDSAGSKGVTKAETTEELEGAVETALKYSHTGAFIVEEFLSIQGYRSDTDVFTIDGKISFISYSDQLFDTQAENPYKPAQIIWPSTMEESCQGILTSEIQRLFDILGMRSGSYNVETCVSSDGIPYIMEISPRGGGNRIAEIQKRAFGIDLIEAEIKSALNIPIESMQYGQTDGCWCEFAIHPEAGQTGVFKNVEINTDVKQKYVKEMKLSIEPGVRVCSRPETGNVLGDIFLKCSDRTELDRLLADPGQWMNLELE